MKRTELKIYCDNCEQEISCGRTASANIVSGDMFYMQFHNSESGELADICSECYANLMARISSCYGEFSR